MPAGGRQIRRGKQSALNARGKLEVALQGALLLLRQALQAYVEQRVSQQSIRFHIALARIANAVGALVHSGKCCVHFAEQT